MTGSNTTSLPACSAFKSAIPAGKESATAFISMASVKIRPSKCSFSRNKVVIIFRLSVEGVLGLGSYAGTLRLRFR